MKKKYLKSLERKLFLKYFMIVVALCVGGAAILYIFDTMLNGVIIDFLRILSIQRDPFELFKQLFAIFLPTTIVITGFILIYFLCKDLARYMRILIEGIDDVLAKKRSKLNFPEEMKSTQEMLLLIASDYQVYEQAAIIDEEKKKDLIYLLAQDIKLPLSNIIMYLDFLEKEERISSEIRKDFVRQVLYKSNHLEDMMNEFFDITRFNLQYAKWNPEHMYLDRMMEQVVDEYYGMMKDKDMEVNLSYQNQMPLFADNEKIARVMRDLLRNLIELGENHKSIEITIIHHETHYDITMQAEAPHLSAYQIAHIFHNYYRLEDIQGKDKQHILGLGVAKQIMDMQKGVLRASSLAHKLTFYVDIPIVSEQENLDV